MCVRVCVTLNEILPRKTLSKAITTNLPLGARHECVMCMDMRVR